MTGHLRIDSDGRRRLWYEPHEIETLGEALLSDAGLLPTIDAPRVDVESLLEQHLRAEVDYGATTPPGVLGYTVFGEPVRVSIDRRLTDRATVDGATAGDIGRWRATLAHEAAHILLHGSLFAVDAGGRVPRSFARCSGATIERATEPKDWREIQANLGMAALLMPASVFDAMLTRLLLAETKPPIPPVPTDSRLGRIVVDTVVDAFQVSRQAAGIRCVGRGFLRPVD